MTIKLYFEEALERREYKDIKDCVILMVLSCVPVHIVSMIVGRIFFCGQENVVKCKLFEDNILSVVVWWRRRGIMLSHHPAEGQFSNLNILGRPRLTVAHFVCQTLINYPKSYIFVKRCKDSFLVPVTDVVGSREGQVLVLNELLYLLYPGKGKGGAQSLL